MEGRESGRIIRDDPLGYFLTLPTYGTWLPGDNRGWVDYHQGWKEPDSVLESDAGIRMTEDACRLQDVERTIVEEVISQHCEFRKWTLHVVNCRTNHIHVVVSAESAPTEVRRQLKAWTTRRLKENSSLKGNDIPREKWWASRGSIRYLNDEDSLEAAILYVRDGQ